MPFGLDDAAAAVSIAGGIKNLFGGGGQKPLEVSQGAIYQQQANQRVLDEARPGWIRKGAEEAGFHPLFVMGAMAQNVAPMVVGQSNTGDRYGEGFSQLSEGISRMSSNNKAKVLEEMMMKEWQQKMITANREQQKIEAETDFIHQQAMSSQNKRMGQQANSMPTKYIKVYNQFTGKEEWMVNPDLNVEYPEAYGASLLMRATQKDLQGSTHLKGGAAPRMGRGYWNK